MTSLPKLVSHFWSLRRQFTKYFITGISAFFIDIGSLFLLKEFVGLDAVVANIINQVFMLNYVFFMNKYWSFKATGMTHRQMVRFYTLAGGNFALSIGWMWLVHRQFGVHYLLTRTLNIALAVCWNFLLYKYWVYRPEHAAAAAEPTEGLVLDKKTDCTSV